MSERAINGKHGPNPSQANLPVQQTFPFVSAAALALAALTGLRQMYHLWEPPDVATLSFTLSDVGVAIAAIAAAWIYARDLATRATLHAAVKANRLLVIVGISAFLWVSIRAVSSWDFSITVSILLQCARSGAVILSVAVLAISLGFARAVAAIFVAGVVVGLISLSVYLVGLTDLLPTRCADGQFYVRELWAPRLGYEVAYAKVIQFEGLAQDPVTIGLVFVPSLIAGLFVSMRGRWMNAGLLTGIAVVELCMVLTLARSIAAAALATGLALVAYVAVSRSRAGTAALIRYVVPISVIGAAVFVFALVTSANASDSHEEVVSPLCAGGIVDRLEPAVAPSATPAPAPSATPAPAPSATPAPAPSATPAPAPTPPVIGKPVPPLLSFDQLSDSFLSKLRGNTSRRFDRQLGVLKETIESWQSALFGHGSKARPKTVITLIENTYLAMLFEYGLLGLGLFSAFFILLFWKLCRAGMKPEMRLFALLFFTWMTVMIFFAPDLFGQTLWLGTGLAFAFIAGVRNPNPEPARTAQPGTRE